MVGVYRGGGFWCHPSTYMHTCTYIHTCIHVPTPATAAMVRTAEEALAAANRIGYPVMLKASEGKSINGLCAVV